MKKFRLICFLLLWVVVLSGGIFSKVEIKTNNDEPLIDLDGLLFGDGIGQPGSTDRGEAVKDEYKDRTPNRTEGMTEGSAAEEPVLKDATVTVRNKMITCMGKTCIYDRATGEAAGMDILLESLKGKTKVTLKDDFAEAHAFRYAEECIKTVAPNAKIDTPVLKDKDK